MLEWLGFQTDREAIHYGAGLFTGAAPFIIYWLWKVNLRLGKEIKELKELMKYLDKLGKP